MIPGGPGSTEDFKQVGDPVNVKHTLADNIDVRYENFSDKADQLILLSIQLVVQPVPQPHKT